MIRLISLSLAALIFVSLGVSSAHAAPPPSAKTADAKSLYKSGTQHYNLAEFEQALADFKEAYRLRSDPVFLFNIAQCHRRLNNPTEAGTFYRSFLRESPNAVNRTEVEKTIVEMDALAQAKTQEAERARAAEAEKARVAQAARDTAARPASGADLSVSAPRPEPKPLVKKWWFWVAIAGSAAVVATGVTLGVVLGTPPKTPSATYTAQVQ